ncbi:hypothetical protein KPH14_006969 [Odynerus spinipes]|uniref:Uncharacterized protein n=1 Tax=Odynerus spinipes TaxID=1348599 RepID=A0AAD9RRI8_9HYME|nr:hypothetical protein KPH14_006969 [Odynerus spinipes]
MKGFLRAFLLFHSIMQLYFLIGVIALVASLGDIVSAQQVSPDRLAQNQDVIDKIFNIPITAVKQSAEAVQSFSPERKQAIDNVFQIPIATLEAVGNLVKSTSAQRLQNADEIQKKRQERRDRIQAQKEEQRLRREQIQNERLQKKASRYPRHHHRDPLGLNSLTKFFIGHDGLFYKPNKLCSIFGDHQTWSSGGHGSHGSHGGHGSHALRRQLRSPVGMLLVGESSRDNKYYFTGGQGIHSSSSTYEVNEEVDEGNGPSVGTFLGLFSSQPKDQIQNKIAPWQGERDSTLEQSGTRRMDKSRFRYEELPLENKIAPRSDRILFI